MQASLLETMTLNNSLPQDPGFTELGLPDTLLSTIEELGYEKPSPIQAKSIPLLLSGRDFLGQAQTGTGKTAAFALPILANLKSDQKLPQALILTPTRELAIQVAEAFQRYSRNVGCQVLPIYGGQSYSNQLKQLKRGVQIVVGTPGRVMDHIRRKSLILDQLHTLVLDEADEMLHMGFLDDVKWILQHIPEKRQIALFSATMPNEIRKVANTYLHDPVHVKIENKTSVVSTIHQRFLMISQGQKLEACARILEVEEYDGVIIFVRTKIATVELADKLSARGYRCQALNGDIQQSQREQIVDKLKKGKFDLLVATDVVARGLDIKRISHVINYDIPLDTESYVHRIGRTGRAGRKGTAILFVTHREQRLLKAIERATKSSIEAMSLPSSDIIQQKRLDRFSQELIKILEQQDLSSYLQFITDFQREQSHDPVKLAAALAYMAQQKSPLFVRDTFQEDTFESSKSSSRRDRTSNEKTKKNHNQRRDSSPPQKKSVDMESYRLEIGRKDGVKPGNIVGAIANEANLDSQFIGHINIQTDHTIVDLPAKMTKDTLHRLKKAYVCGKPMQLRSV
ncbi:MAG: ATP-dependent RNA helicase DeaD [Cellvibrionaceae bacterium]